MGTFPIKNRHLFRNRKKSRDMKKYIFCCLLSVSFLSVYAQYGNDRTGYDGDFFSLEGALDLFKQSTTLGDFERKLNTEKYWVNNLDLNYDGRIDYVRVEHRRQGNIHAIILQALVDRYDIQDVAVIELEVIGRGEAVLQIIGDEDLYGEEVIVEPIEGYADSRRGSNPDYGDYVNVYYWPPVQYILGRQYRVYASPYHWQYYPTWWSPWVHISWNVFRPRVVVYVKPYRIARRHRVIRVHHFYRPYRTYCNVVVERANTVRVDHGRAPIQRPPAARQRDWTPNDRYQGRSEAVQQPRPATRTETPRQEPSVLSRKRTETSGDRDDVRRSVPRTTEQRTYDPGKEPVSGRSSSATRATTPEQRPPVSRNSSPRYDEGRERSTSPQTNRSSSSSANRSGNSDRSTAPNVRQEPRSSTTTTRSNPPVRSRTETRATTPARKPSVENRSSVPAAKSERSTSSPSRTGTSKSIPKSRKGGGEE